MNKKELTAQEMVIGERVAPIYANLKTALKVLVLLRVVPEYDDPRVIVFKQGIKDIARMLGIKSKTAREDILLALRVLSRENPTTVEGEKITIVVGTSIVSNEEIKEELEACVND